jgi:hypothetical protein
MLHTSIPWEKISVAIFALDSMALSTFRRLSRLKKWRLGKEVLVRLWQCFEMSKSRMYDLGVSCAVVLPILLSQTSKFTSEGTNIPESIQCTACSRSVQLLRQYLNKASFSVRHAIVFRGSHCLCLQSSVSMNSSTTAEAGICLRVGR